MKKETKNVTPDSALVHVRIDGVAHKWIKFVDDGFSSTIDNARKVLGNRLGKLPTRDSFLAFWCVGGVLSVKKTGIDSLLLNLDPEFESELFPGEGVFDFYCPEKSYNIILEFSRQMSCSIRTVVILALTISISDNGFSASRAILGDEGFAELIAYTCELNCHESA